MKELAVLERASAAIELVQTVGEAKDIADKAAAIKIIAAKQKWGQHERGRIAAIEIRATARMGELLADDLRQGRPKSIPAENTYSLDDLGITAKQSHVAQAVASVPIRDRERFIAEAAENASVTGIVRLAKSRKRQAKRDDDRKAVESAPDPAEIAGVYSTIVIDPPWDWGDEGDADQMGRARPDYATMSIEEIAALPVGERAATDAHLYLWITNRSLPKGFGLIEAWGFRYVTCLTWCKPSIGMGNYYRGSTEQVLFAVRGSLPLSRKDVGTWFAAPRPARKHSAKPDEFYAMVESCSPGPYLDMFARKDRPNWVRWGS